MTPQQARDAFAGARVARLATLRPNGAPHLVPVVFAVRDELILTAVDAKPKTTRALARLANVRADPRVCLLADGYTEDWTRLWWARADGEAEVHASGPLLAETLQALAGRYPQARPLGPALVVRVRRWTGWSAASPTG
jgi:PPOX class probable F420-dependent enzyme